ncbi:hypothetical protein Cantr_09133 [Candida viswanathii]|uniref:Sodium/calcium exchanger membrane region domain-containing protein n=1 Tax=Candida viswanathii TaxID=5486 RepID=A0A367Y9X1_9ASCO|nr:hypothetical protein Cantr_09133 [Candida viswanathii]
MLLNILDILDDDSAQCSIPPATKHICSYIRHNCDYDYFKISTLYYCKYHTTTSLVLISCCILLSLMLILVSLSILVSNYLFKNLNTLTTQLNLNTQILSFILIPLTNSLPDLLNYYIALKSGSVDLVIGQLMGSLLIMFTVIIGLICILTLGYVVDHPKVLMLDLSILLIVMVLFLEILSDGKITQAECWVMIGSYLAYILFLMFFDKDKLKEFDEEVLLEYHDHSHLYEHPYNIEDAVSILSHEDVTSYGSIRSVSRVNSPTVEEEYGNSLQVPGRITSHGMHESGVPEYQTLSIPSSKSSPSPECESDLDDSEVEQEVDANPGYDEEIIMVPQPEESLVQHFLSFVDFLFFTFVPYHRHVESKHRELIIFWYVFETTILYNFQFFEIPYAYVLPVSLLVYLCSQITELPHAVKLIVVSFVGLTSSLVIISNFAVLTLYLLKNLGLVMRILDYLLGLLVFSLSNSLNDTITNLTISTKINPLLGINSCIGTPLLIVLLGIGVNGLAMTLKTGKSIKFHLTDGVIISTAGLLFSTVCLLVYLPLNKYTIDRKIGAFLVMLYFVITIVEVYLE